MGAACNRAGGGSMSSETAFPADMLEFTTLVIKTKRDIVSANMMEGFFVCLRCQQQVLVRVVGPKNHARAACETNGCLSMME